MMQLNALQKIPNAEKQNCKSMKDQDYVSVMHVC